MSSRCRWHACQPGRDEGRDEVPSVFYTNSIPLARIENNRKDIAAAHEALRLKRRPMQ
jgi:hypothetical protein